MQRRNSMRSSRTRKSNKSAVSGNGDDSDDDNPHYKIIGKSFVKSMKKNRTYIEKLGISDFRQI